MSVTPSYTTSLDWRDRVIGALIFVGVFIALLGTMEMGFTRDESFYFHAARDYLGWFHDLAAHWRADELAKSFTQANVDKHWGYNPEHPVLMKTLFALSLELFHNQLDWCSASTAMRLPTAALSAWLVAMVYGFARQLSGRAAGILAACALILQPRFFFHAHLACFDAAMGAMWFAVVWAYWRSWTSRRWAVLCGLLWGLALATKLNAFFLPVVLVAHWLWATWRGFGIDREDGWRVRLPAMPWAFVAMAILGPLVFYMHWPRIWFDTFERVRWYINFHLTHTHYFVDYFGQNLYTPPFPRSFPYVMTLVTVPVGILLAAALGAGYWWRDHGVFARLEEWRDAWRERSLPAPIKDARATGALLFINFLFPLALIARPTTPVFGGTKHWIPAMPYLSMLAGFGAVMAARHLWSAYGAWVDAARQRAVRAALSGAAALALVVPAGVQLANNHPYGTSYYNEVLGSHRGAADAKMMRQFWGYASRGVADWLNAHAPKNARVWTHNTTRWAWEEYQREGIIRKDLRPASVRGSDLAIYFHQKAFTHNRLEMWEHYDMLTPVHVLELDGVPLVSIYATPETLKQLDL